jgi:hypothetical protein
MSLFIGVAQAMELVSSRVAIQSAIAALFYFVKHASLPASPHVDILCGAISRANLDLQADLVPLLTDLASDHQSLCSHSPAFLTLAVDTISKIEAVEQMTRSPLIIPFTVCAPSCEVCTQLHGFCTSPTAVRTEIQRAGANSKNRRHVMSIMESYSQHVTINTHTSR